MVFGQVKDYHAGYEQAEQERINSKSLGSLEYVKKMWREDPEKLGSIGGLFFGFGSIGPTGSGVCAGRVPNLIF